MKHPRTDIVVFGATSFVGQIVCRYLVDQYGTDGEVSWAIAGRSPTKLDDVAAATGAEVPRIVADADDADALAAMCASTDVVISTVGPYALYGSKLIAAAVEAGIAYCDLTGEPHWMANMIDLHHERAVETGARIVHACGFDSVPSDLGVWHLQQAATERYGEPCTAVRMGVKAMSGRFSGGTVASMLNLMEDAASDPALRKVLANPYALAPRGQRTGVRQPDVTWPEYHDGLRSWQAAFVMAATNTRVVHRTHALLGRPWGDDFTYAEAMLTGSGLKGQLSAAALSGGMAGFGAAASFGPTRSVLSRVLPDPGEGPTVEQQQDGFYKLLFHGRTASGEEITTRVTGDRDPGYGSTSKMLGEAAMTLLDNDLEGGFWTPATGLGEPYLERLTDRAGLTFDVLD